MSDSSKEKVVHDVKFTGALQKRVPARIHRVEFNWVNSNFMLFETFRKARERMGLGIFDHCFWCKKKFADADMMALAQPKKGANRTLCQDCAAQAVVTP